MCGRYARKSDKQKIAEAFHVAVEGIPDFAFTFNAAPQSFQPIVRLNAETGEREIAMMRWGLIPFWSKDAKIGSSTINAKAETVATSPVFREAFKKRRCLVPADAFYEWQKLDAKNKQPYAIAMKSGEPYGFAGVWDRWKQPDGNRLETFTIITTDPNSLVEPFHNRMPVILEPKNYERWLDCSDASKLPTDLLRAFPAEMMTAWAVNKDVGNTRNDRPELMERVEVAEADVQKAGAQDHDDVGLFAE